MSAMPRRSCSPILRRRSPARSFTSMPVSVASSLASALLRGQSPKLALLLLEVRAVHFDIGAALKARDISFVLPVAEDAGHALCGIGAHVLGVRVDHLVDAYDEVARIADRHADIG